MEYPTQVPACLPHKALYCLIRILNTRHRYGVKEAFGTNTLLYC